MNPFNKILLKFAGAQGVSNILRIIAGFLVVKLIAPEVYGEFTGPGIYLTYFMLLHLGINNGLSRELPFELGSGNKERVDQYASVGLFVNTIISAFTFFVFMVVSIQLFTSGNNTGGIIYGTYSIVSIFNLMNKAYLPVLFRTNADFDKLAKIQFILGFVNILSVIFVFFFGLIGLCIRMVLLFLIEFALLFFQRPIRVLPKFSWSHNKTLLKVGIPIYLVGHVNILWSNILNNIILVKGGAIFLGYYALSNIISSALGVIPNSFGQIIYPKMSIMFGEGKPLKEILKIVWTPMKMQFFMLLGIAIICSIILPLAVGILLPKYEPGVVAAQWMLFLPVVSSFNLFCNLFNVVKKQFWYFVSLVSGAMIGVIYIVIMYSMVDFKLEHFPQGLIVGTVPETVNSESVFLLFFKSKNSTG